MSRKNGSPESMKGQLYPLQESIWLNPVEEALSPTLSQVVQQ